MLLNLLLDAAENTTPATADQAQGPGGGIPTWAITLILVVMIVGFLLMSIIPNKRRQKEYQQMQNEIRVGTKIMTIGRMIGTITKVYPDKTVEVDVGTPGNPVIITISREAIGVNLTAQEEAKAQQEAMKNKKKGIAQKVENKDENSGNVATAENSENQVETTENTETVAPEVANTNSKDDDAI